MTVNSILDGEQALLDLEEAEAKLRIIALAVDKRDRLRMLVTSLKRQLKQAQQECQQAEWDVGATARRVAEHVRRRAKR